MKVHCCTLSRHHLAFHSCVISHFLYTFSHSYLQVVGKWFNSLELNLQDVVWNHAQELPTSACSLPCEAGMIKKQQVRVLFVLACHHKFIWNPKICRVILAVGCVTIVRSTNTCTMRIRVVTAVLVDGHTKTSCRVSTWKCNT